MFEYFPLIFAVVPLIIIAVGLVGLVRNGRRVLVVSMLNARGRRTTGRVVSSNVQVTQRTTSSSHTNRTSSTMVETIAFTTADGQSIRALPFASDIGMLDRSGTEVEVIYDDRRPDRFVAPGSGTSFAVWHLLGPMAISIITIVFALFFLRMTSGFFDSSFFGGSVFPG